MCGTENILYAMADDPAWPMDMFNHGCDLTLALLDMIWDEGYTFDELMWFDDMAYRGGMIFSKRDVARDGSALPAAHHRLGPRPRDQGAPPLLRRTSTPSFPSCSTWAWTRSTRWRSRPAWTPST